MGIYRDIEILRREGLPPAERGFVTQAVDRATDAYLFDMDLPGTWYDYGRDGRDFTMREIALSIDDPDGIRVVNDWINEIHNDTRRAS